MTFPAVTVETTTGTLDLLTQPLDQILANRRWASVREPFPHVRANDVFTVDVYRSLELAFLELKQAAAISSEQRRTGFSRSIATFDALIARIPEDPGNPLRLFVSRPWHDLLASFFEVPVTGDVNAELHHHQLGSASGRIHNDLNPGWFTLTEKGGINLSDNRRCNYKYGTSRVADVPCVQRVRAVAMIFYLGNPRWRPGDGGTTGLYRTSSDAVETAHSQTPPINNSLVAFSCTPYSFHSFLSNTRSERNSIVLWLHQTYDNAVARWGESAILKWPKPKG